MRCVAARGARSPGAQRAPRRPRRSAGPQGGGRSGHGDKVSAPSKRAELLRKAEHERFDEAYIAVQGGKGGKGEVWSDSSARGRTVKNFKYRGGKGGQGGGKRLFVPAQAPSKGMDGGSVYLEASENHFDLLHLHDRYLFKARDGSAANPATASLLQKQKATSFQRADTLVIPVPVGTVVSDKRKEVFEEMLHPGERLRVASGGRGGMGVTKPKTSKRRSFADPDNRFVAADSTDWKVESRGLDGDMRALHLVMRIVADVGLVGLPNAGKSTLLSTITRAKPDIADYPFTTLVPNLGVLHAQGQDSGTAIFDPLDSAVVADLPGLIQDAHRGRGLGRVFLRHLKRTSLVCHLVDSTADDPLRDYLDIRNELRMYNPDYVVAKPHVLVFTKSDLLGVEREGAEARAAGFVQAAAAAQEDAFSTQGVTIGADKLAPLGVAHVSAKTGEGVESLLRMLSSALATAQDT